MIPYWGITITSITDVTGHLQQPSPDPEKRHLCGLRIQKVQGHWTQLIFPKGAPKNLVATASGTRWDTVGLGVVDVIDVFVWKYGILCLYIYNYI